MGVTRRDASVFGLGVLTGILVTIVGAFVAAFVLAVMFRNLERSLLERPRFIAAAERQEASLEWTVTDLDGRPLDLSQLKGRVVFLNFWATWCGPCRLEIPSLQRLVGLTKDSGIAFVFASREDASVVSAFLKKEGLTLPCYTWTGDPPKGFETEAIPTTYIVDPQGRVAMRHVGGANWDELQLVKGILALASGEDPATTTPSPAADSMKPGEKSAATQAATRDAPKPESPQPPQPEASEKAAPPR